MRRRPPFSAARLAWLALLLSIAAHVGAHRIDEYLQAALVTITTNSVQLRLDLTPGIAVASAVLAQIDLNHDGRVSALETEAYADRVRSSLTLKLDGNPLELSVRDMEMPDLVEFQSGLSALRLEFTAPVPSLSFGTHELFFANRHQTNRSVYLVNATLPRTRAIQIERQVRNENQSQGRIQFRREDR